LAVHTPSTQPSPEAQAVLAVQLDGQEAAAPSQT
jgi:hypothetical protein